MKNNYKMFVILIGILVILSVTTYIVSGTAGTQIEIRKHVFDITVQEDGSSLVEENITYKLHRKNGVIRDYKYNGTKKHEMELIDVIANDVEILQKVNAANIGDSGVYTFKEDVYSQELKVYQPTNGKLQLNIRYRVEGIVSEYNDMQLFNWIFYDTFDNTLPSKNVEVNIHFPTAITKEDMKVFAHGNLNGTIEIIDEQNVQVKVPLFVEKTFREATILLPTKPLQKFNGVRSTEDAYQTWLESELQNSRKTNENQTNDFSKEALGKTYINIIGYLQAIIILIVIFLTYKWYREITMKYNTEEYIYPLDYYRELPTDYSVCVAALVENPDKKINQKQLTAGLFNLYVKKYIQIDLEEHEGKEEIFLTVLSKSTETLFPEEEYLYQWILKVARKTNKKISYKKFAASEKNTSVTARRFFIGRYKSYCRKIEKQYENLKYKKFTNPNNGYKTNVSLCGYIIFLTAGVGYFLEQKISIIILLSIIGLLIIMVDETLMNYKMNSYIYTEKGALEHARMRGLKKYLEDYSLLEKAGPSLVNLWEEYYVMGMAFGVNGKAQRLLYTKLPEDIQQNEMSDNTCYVMNRMAMYHDVNKTSSKAIRKSILKVNAADEKSAKNNRNDSSGSSSFGDGGGFSDGGGFGAGGGGGRSF